MELKYQNISYNVETSNTDDVFSAFINQEKSDFSLRKITDNTYQIVSDSGNLIVYAADDEKNVYVNIHGRMFTFEKESESEASFDMDAGAKGDKDTIKSIMPGSVVKILVQKGQKVSEGDGLIVLVAMKMESTLFASIDGIVTEINTEEGEQVGTDKVLIVVEKEVSG